MLTDLICTADTIARRQWTFVWKIGYGVLPTPCIKSLASSSYPGSTWGEDRAQDQALCHLLKTCLMTKNPLVYFTRERKLLRLLWSGLLGTGVQLETLVISLSSGPEWNIPRATVEKHNTRVKWLFSSFNHSLPYLICKIIKMILRNVQSISRPWLITCRNLTVY